MGIFETLLRENAGDRVRAGVEYARRIMAGRYGPRVGLPVAIAETTEAGSLHADEVIQVTRRLTGQPIPETRPSHRGSNIAAAAHILTMPTFATLLGAYVRPGPVIVWDEICDKGDLLSDGEKVLVNAAWQLFSGRSSVVVGVDPTHAASLANLTSSLDHESFRYVVRALEIGLGRRIRGGEPSYVRAGE